eukprot:TRINITY_DN9753_c0_g1_i1.p1 TRINITY_DN9753_c0_g1~~TRINITY_DN9753_c0_g1_i1.p1  ORF type:complete len:640 (+),score=122.95 TRINITY_DN9753_c0_g1_i1:137-1921(+)
MTAHRGSNPRRESSTECQSPVTDLIDFFCSRLMRRQFRPGGAEYDDANAERCRQLYREKITAGYSESQLGLPLSAPAWAEWATAFSSEWTQYCAWVSPPLLRESMTKSFQCQWRDVDAVDPQLEVPPPRPDAKNKDKRQAPAVRAQPHMCVVCQMRCNSLEQYRTHAQGQRHRDRVAQQGYSTCPPPQPLPVAGGAAAPAAAPVPAPEAQASLPPVPMNAAPVPVDPVPVQAVNMASSGAGLPTALPVSSLPSATQAAMPLPSPMDGSASMPVPMAPPCPEAPPAGADPLEDFMMGAAPMAPPPQDFFSSGGLAPMAPPPQVSGSQDYLPVAPPSQDFLSAGGVAPSPSQELSVLGLWGQPPPTAASVPPAGPPMMTAAPPCGFRDPIPSAPPQATQVDYNAQLGLGLPPAYAPAPAAAYPAQPWTSGDLPHALGLTEELGRQGSGVTSPASLLSVPTTVRSMSLGLHRRELAQTSVEHVLARPGGDQTLEIYKGAQREEKKKGPLKAAHTIDPNSKLADEWKTKMLREALRQPGGHRRAHLAQEKDLPLWRFDPYNFEDVVVSAAPTPSQMSLADDAERQQHTQELLQMMSEN